MDTQKIDWFDLSGENASLKLMAKNTHRTAKVCIVFNEGISQLKSIILDNPDIIAEAGFDLQSSINMEASESLAHKRDTNHDKFVLYSQSDLDGRLSLASLQRIFPNLTKDNLVPTSIQEITDFSGVFPYENQWKELYQKHYADEFQNVWHFENFDASGYDQETWPPTRTSQPTAMFSGTQQKLENLGYKPMMGAPIFASREDGEIFARQNDLADLVLKQSNFPFALPLQIDRDSKTVYAITDVRSMSDLIYCDLHSGHDAENEVEYVKQLQNPIYNLRLSSTIDQEFRTLHTSLGPLRQQIADEKSAFGTIEEETKAIFRKETAIQFQQFLTKINAIVSNLDVEKISPLQSKYDLAKLEEYAELSEQLDMNLAESNPQQFLQAIDAEYGLNRFIGNGIAYALTAKELDVSDANEAYAENDFYQLFADLSAVTHESDQIELLDDEFDFVQTESNSESIEADSAEHGPDEPSLDTSLEEPSEGQTEPEAPTLFEDEEEFAADRDDRSKEKINDVGAKIGGARKDFHRSHLNVSDLDKFNQRELETLVTKANVWPPLDYEAMQEMGFTAEAATAIKIVKDAISVQPGKDGRRTYFQPNEKNSALYITAVGSLRDHLLGKDPELDPEGEFPPAKTLQEVYSRLSDWNARMSGRPSEELKSWGSGLSEYHQALGSKACNYYIRPKDNISYTFVNEIQRPFKKAQRNTYGQDIDYTSWAHLIKNAKVKTDAEKDAAKQKKEINDQLHNPVPPHLEAEITETKWRNGQDVSEHQLLEDFNFKGLEFGNWLNQNERQHVVNFAYDSFCDLADILDVPKEAVSLGGNLSIGFGSRGRGGRNAALAHYEPARKVINLTKIKGAGTLAHEWFHALDDYLGNYKSNYASEKYDSELSEVMNAAKKSNDTPESYIDSVDAANTKYTRYAVSWTQEIFKGQSYSYSEYQAAATEILKEYVAQKVGPKISQYLANITDPEEKVFTTRTGLTNFITGNDIIAIAASSKDKLDELIKTKFHQGIPSPMSKKSLKNYHGCMEAAIPHMVSREFVRQALKQGFRFENNALGKIDSNFYSDAKKLDSFTGRTKPYWSTNKEMLARAGAAYVQDKLAQAGKVNQYLVNGSEENAHKKICAFSPNPQGMDRQRINAQFDESFKLIKVILENAVESSHKVTHDDTPSMGM